MSKNSITSRFKLLILVSLQLNSLLATSVIPDLQVAKTIEGENQTKTGDSIRYYAQKIAKTDIEGVNYYVLYIVEKKKKSLFSIVYKHSSMVIMRAEHVLSNNTNNTDEVKQEEGADNKNQFKLDFANKKDGSLIVHKAITVFKTYGASYIGESSDIAFEFTHNGDKSKGYFRLILKTKSDCIDDIRLLRLKVEIKSKTNFEKIKTNEDVIKQLNELLEKETNEVRQEFEEELFEDINDEKIQSAEDRNNYFNNLGDGTQEIDRIDISTNKKMNKDDKNGENKLEFKQIVKDTKPEDVVKNVINEEEKIGNVMDEVKEPVRKATGEMDDPIVLEDEEDVEEDLEVKDKDKDNKKRKKNKVLLIVAIIAGSVLLVLIMVAVVIKVKSSEVKQRNN